MLKPVLSFKSTKTHKARLFTKESYRKTRGEVDVKKNRSIIRSFFSSIYVS